MKPLTREMVLNGDSTHEQVLAMLEERDRFVAELALWRKVTGYADAEALDFSLGRAGVDHHLHALGRYGHEQKASRDALADSLAEARATSALHVAAAERAMKRADEARGAALADGEEALAKLLGVHLFSAIDVTMTQRQVVQHCIDTLHSLKAAKPETPRAEAAPRMFPIHSEDRRELKTPPYAIEWAFVAPHEAQALANHSQTLECLASRGGLGWDELYAVVAGLRWRDKPVMTTRGYREAVLAAFEEWRRGTGRAPEAADLLRGDSTRVLREEPARTGVEPMPMPEKDR